MNRTILTATIAAAGLFVAAGLTQAADVDDDCKFTGDRDDMNYGDAQAVYDCLAEDMQANYGKGDKRWIPAEFVKDYRKWAAASTLPADPGVHDGRFLFTYVNDIGAEEYMKFADEDVAMPVGSVIAKESFTIGENGKAKPGPLFLMQKVKKGISPRTGDWYYMAVAPNGTPMAPNVYTACHACHEAYEDSDYMGYPEEDVRVGG